MSARHPDSFANRHIGPDDTSIAEMLKLLGFNAVRLPFQFSDLYVTKPQVCRCNNIFYQLLTLILTGWAQTAHVAKVCLACQRCVATLLSREAQVAAVEPLYRWCTLIGYYLHVSTRKNT